MAEARTKVLLIDSETTLTLALSDALVDHELSCAPLLARSADQALAFLRSEPAIGLVVLDLGLPGADGQALAERILSEFPGTALILTSTLGCAELRAEFGGRALGFLQKPFDLEDFMQLSFKGLNAP